MCFYIVTLDMFLIFNFRPIITWTPFLNMENAENEENNTTNYIYKQPPLLSVCTLVIEIAFGFIDSISCFWFGSVIFCALYPFWRQRNRKWQSKRQSCLSFVEHGRNFKCHKIWPMRDKLPQKTEKTFSILSTTGQPTEIKTENLI